MADTWVGVELRHLAALTAVHEERTFRGAAERLGYVQSAVSQQIAQLEALVGARLVDRSRGNAPPVRLTDAGHLLLDHARRILGQLDAAQADLRTLAAGDAQTLRVGAVQSVATRLLPPALLQLGRSHPSLVVSIEEASSDRAHFASVERGDVDAAFGELPLENGDFEAVEVLQDPCVLLVRADDPLAARERPVELADLAELPLVGIQGWARQELIEASLRSAGHDPRFAMRVDTNGTVQALVGAGVGRAILPRLAVNESDPTVVALDLTDVVAPRRLALYWHVGRRQLTALEHFRTAVRTAAREIAAEYRQAAEAAAPAAVL